MMRSDLAFYLVTGGFLLLLVLLTRWRWRHPKTAPATPRPNRGQRDPKPFVGYTCQPECERCAQEVECHPQMPGAPPPRMGFTRGRRRSIETTGHCCPHAACAYHGRVDWGNLRANGHPNGRHWRQLYCLGCRGYFLETHGTPFHGKQVAPDTLVWAMAALAEGLGIRAVARVFEAAPNTVLGWLVEAAEHLEAFSRYFLHDVDVEQGQMDELFALLSAVKDGEVTEAKAIQRLSRSPHWVWVAMDPVCKLILTVDVGERTLAMAQRLVPQLIEGLAPACTPLFLTDGLRDSLTAFVPHYGHWMHPERHEAKGPQPRLRWMPQPELL